jgi:hypothetical protein
MPPKQLINLKYSISKNKILLKIFYFPSKGVDLWNKILIMVMSHYWMSCVFPVPTKLCQVKFGSQDPDPYCLVLSMQTGYPHNTAYNLEIPAK